MFKKIIKAELGLWVTIAILSLVTSCKKETPSKDLANNWETEFIPGEKSKDKKELSQEFKVYWYAGEAEITSYKLEQARYGEMREGKAVLVYVTEDFLAEKQVKADTQNPDNIPVLKLNATKNFNTGIYPYSIMQSTFYPVSNNNHAIKVSASVQEWCGHVYAQLNNKAQFEIMSHSYFESEADEHFKLEKAILENELWTQLRIDPKSLPTGDLQIIPSLEFTRLKHVPVKAYKALAKLSDQSYSISYPGLNRTLTISFNPDFPYDILGWEESFKSGFGTNAKTLTTRATKLKTIKSAYWNKNSNENEVLRDTLQLN
tara:strand:+ start:3147 stop:4097 length:951 start_codon:yes stop_codon:yes gene_type:complete